MRKSGSSGQVHDAKVAILLCTRNSAAFLREQMGSYFSQDYDNWELWVSDDGSTDATLEIVREYADRGKSITVVDGPQLGATANFLSLTQRVEGDADFFAWSDADDIWLPDKLSRALRYVMTAVDGNRPALYCGRTEIVDVGNVSMYLSTLHRKPPSFQNALCQNIGGGNTMVFNRTLRDLLCGGVVSEVPCHDWWAYILATGCGGKVFYDPVPCLRYRQHGSNVAGCNLGVRAKLWRGRVLFDGVPKSWNRLHVEALLRRVTELTLENRNVLEWFAKAMDAASVWSRLRYFRRSGVHRQSALYTLALYAMTVIGKYP